MHEQEPFYAACGSRAPSKAEPMAAPLRGPIVLALQRGGHPTQTLLRALALARVRGVELHVLKVLPNLPRERVRFARRSFVESIRAAERVVSANQATATWLIDTIVDASAVERFAVVYGEFSEQVCTYVEQFHAQAIVVSPGDLHIGGVATSLARTAGIPVLVARDKRGHETIVAATDLRDSDYPVLNKAAEWSRQLKASVVAIHNVNPLSVAVSFEMEWPIVVLRAQPSYAYGGPR